MAWPNDLIDSIWLVTEPMDMRAGTETALVRVVVVFGAAKPHCAYLFAYRRANRMPKQRASEIEQLLPHQWIPVYIGPS